MKFGRVSTGEAGGAILAHSLALNEGRLRKGVILASEHLERIAAAGITEVTVAQLDPEDLHEDEAASQLAASLVPDPARAGLRLSAASTGRVNLFADGPGIAEIDRRAIDAVNGVDPMITVATVPQWQRMTERGMVATVKIIAYGVAAARLEAASAFAQGAIRLRRPVITRAQLIQTSVGAEDGHKGHAAIAARLEALGATLGPLEMVRHETGALSEALRRCAAEAIFILTGSATSDIRDVAPEAVRLAGGEVAHFGMPVDPGNLLFLGRIGKRPVIGLPGCARSPALNGADWVLERVLCGVPVGPEDIQAMGVGGLLKEIPQRGRLREAGAAAGRAAGNS